MVLILCPGNEARDLDIPLGVLENAEELATTDIMTILPPAIP